MYSNRHANRLVSLKRETEQVTAGIQHLHAELGWFAQFDHESAHTRLSQLQRENLISREELVRIEQSIQVNRTEHSSAVDATNAGFWIARRFTSAHKVAVAQVTTLQDRLAAFKRRKDAVTLAVREATREAKALTADLQRYRGIDTLQARAKIKQKEIELQGLRGLVEEVSEASARWEAVAGVVYRNWKSTYDQLEAMEQDIIDAACFLRKLDDAQSNFEKRQIHEQCEGRFGFGNGSPRKVLNDLHYRLRKAEKEEVKSKRRLRDTVRLLDNEIRNLVVDGNNLCYLDEEGGRRSFIGLGALKVLVPHLAETFGITLVFDPGIRSQLDLTDDALKALFPQARVLVMPRTLGADHSVLGVAEFDVQTYVISNDSYSDYWEMAAVRDGRVLHAIVNRDSVQVPQLQLQLPY